MNINQRIIASALVGLIGFIGTLGVMYGPDNWFSITRETPPDAPQGLSAPAEMSYTGRMFKYELNTDGRGSDINIVEFYNKRGEHCMVAQGNRVEQFQMACENH